ncbi:uncharacterized protein LOC118581950 [Onychomys torridus]|uniref:uncharacterized protein LOC118581950 n=1 Tax=Onychomys torridus TaxID=38674 RepID=UPI00167F7A7C|nr:uncharacterized protein LOC118581950 [Onychomys torridus]
MAFSVNVDSNASNQPWIPAPLRDLSLVSKAANESVHCIQLQGHHATLPRDYTPPRVGRRSGRGAGHCGRAGAGARGSPGPSLWGSTAEAPAHCACAPSPATRRTSERAGGVTWGLGETQLQGSTAQVTSVSWFACWETWEPTISGIESDDPPDSQAAVTVQSWHHRTWATPSTHPCPPHMRLRNSTQDQRRRTGPPRCPAMMQLPQDPPVAIPAAYAGAAAAAAPGMWTLRVQLALGRPHGIWAGVHG